jgi:uncharacterized protein YecE (DUF72 family)
VTAPSIRIGTAGWSIPAAAAPGFAGAGTQLERYARRFGAVEINSSFYRPHRRTTYERWAAGVPGDFRFSVKLPGSITHKRRLQGCEELVERFADDVAGLGEKFGALLVQLPPSLPFSAEAADFLHRLRLRFEPPLMLEPRHPTWFAPAVEAWLAEAAIARVAADPARAAGADRPGGWPGAAYFRLHGAPRIYWSRYDEAALERWRHEILQAARGRADIWVIFDNTAAGAAIENAAELAASIIRASASREC